MGQGVPASDTTTMRIIFTGAVVILVSCFVHDQVDAGTHNGEDHTISKRQTPPDPVYEIIYPNVHYLRWNNDGLVVEFVGLGSKFNVTLYMNKDLVRPGATLVRKQASQDVNETLPFTENCYLIGSVTKYSMQDEVQGSGKAAFYKCAGLDGSMFIDGTEIRVVPKVPGSNNITAQHVIYPAEGEGAVDMDHDTVKVEAVDTTGARRKRNPSTYDFVELMVAIDNDVYTEMVDESITYSLSQLNRAQAIFMDDVLDTSNVKVIFTVTLMVIFETDLLLNTAGVTQWSDINEFYQTFAYDWEASQTYRSSGDTSPDYYDIALVFGGTKIIDDGDDNGVSSLYGCHSQNRYIAIRHTHGDFTARVVARQLGHVIGMDDNTGQNCSNSIMSNINYVSFDQCSVNDASSYLSSQDGDCFTDTPDENQVFQQMTSEDSRVDFECFLRYRDDATYISLRACPWRRTYEAYSCDLYCERLDRVTLAATCINETTSPSYPDPTCGNNQVCQGSTCSCPSGTSCDNTSGLSLLGIDSYFVVSATSYDDAESQCAAQNGTLAEILDYDIQVEIESLLDSHTEHDVFYFILNRDPSQANEWLMRQTTLLSLYQLASSNAERYYNWAAGEPDEDTKPCLVLSRSNGYSWIDYSCDASIGAVCQKTYSYYTYWSPKTKYPWSQARDHCVQYSGSLAKVTRSAEQTAIETYLSGNPDVPTGDRVFFDLHIVGGAWHWSGGVELSGYTNWLSGEPNQPSTKQCAVIRTNYQWEDDDCTKTFNRYHVCQFECTEPAPWCHNGNMVFHLSNNTCECKCNAGWSGLMCLQPEVTPKVSYWVSSATQDYTASSQDCVTRGGRLAKAISAEMDTNLASYLGTYSTENIVMFGMQKVNGVWVDSEGRQVGTYINWKGTHPNSNDCADARGTSNWQWYGRDCSWTGVPHVCEFDCEGETSWCVKGTLTDTSYGCSCQCFYGWIDFSCGVHNATYYIHEDTTNGNDAAAKCTAKNARLAVIDDASVQQKVEDFLAGSGTSYTQFYFDLSRDGAGTWVNTHETQTYFNWLWSVEENEDCSTLRLDHGSQWQANPCTWSGSRHALCELDCYDSAWCVNGVLDSTNCVCNCDTGYTGTLCDQATKKRSVVEEEIEKDVQVSVQERDSPGQNAGLPNNENLVHPTCYDSMAGMRKDCSIEQPGHTFQITVTKNIELVSPNAKVQCVVEGVEESFYQIEPEHCFFIGSVTKTYGNGNRIKAGRAALNMCDGMEGTLIFDDERYQILPVQYGEDRQTVEIVKEDPRQSSNVASEFDPDNIRSNLWDGINLRHKRNVHGGITNKHPERASRSTADAGATMHVELLLTIDYDFYQLHGEASVKQSLSLINQAQSIFRHSSLVDSSIYISLHVINIQVMKTPHLLSLHKLDQWRNIVEAYVTYSDDWETKFWIPDDSHPEHYDIAMLLTGPSDDDDVEAMTTYRSCNEDRTSVVRYSTTSHTSAVIAHTLSLMLGMYYDFKSPVCEVYEEDDADFNGILTDPDRLYFTECNRNDVIFYYKNPAVDCYDDSPVPESPSDIDNMLYPNDADALCASLYEDNAEYFSIRVCPWMYPSDDCTLYCELQHRRSSSDEHPQKKICKEAGVPMPSNSGVPCKGNKECDGSVCACPQGRVCNERRKRSASIHPRFYTFHKHRHIDQASADVTCRENFGMLFEIPNTETQALVEDLIAGATSFDYFYMGFRRNSVNSDTWEFINATEVTYFNWETNEPNENNNECAVMSRDNGYKWIDFSCDSGAGFICQYDCYFETEWCIHGSISNSTGTTCTCVCESGWHGDFCELMDTPGASSYEVATSSMNKTAAGDHCSNLARVRLPSVSTEASYNEFVDYLQNNGYSGETFYVDLALVDNLWVDGDYKTPQETFWASGEPVQGKDCVTISSTYSYEWKSVDCSQTHRVACEFACSQTDEDWCKYGDIVLNQGSCECQCWDGSLGTYCDQFDYNDMLNKTILFYEIQRSGYMPATKRIGWRANSHLQDVGQNGEDLTGGWYDAGNFVKFTLTTSENVMKLAWGLLEFKSAYVDANELDNMYDCLKWGTDFLLKMHVEPNTTYAQVGSVDFAKSNWQRPENSTEGVRVGLQLNSTHPGSDVAGLAAAAFAASYLAFQDENQTYADILLDHARNAYIFANTYRGIWSNSLPVKSYVSSSYGDDLAFAAIWLYNATGESQYLQDAEDLYTEFGLHYQESIFSWAKMHIPLQLMLYLHTSNTTYLEKVEETFDVWMNSYQTPKGLVWYTSNRPLKRVLDVSFLALICVKHGIHAQQYFDFAEQQIHYALGSSGRSFVSGFGHNPPEKVHHQAASCPADIHEVCSGSTAKDNPDANPHVVYGGLMGGPDTLDRFFDHRRNWAQTEAGINVSGFQGAVAALAYFRNQ